MLKKVLASPNKPKKESKFKNFCKATFQLHDKPEVGHERVCGCMCVKQECARTRTHTHTHTLSLSLCLSLSRAQVVDQLWTKYSSMSK